MNSRVAKPSASPVAGNFSFGLQVLDWRPLRQEGRPGVVILRLPNGITLRGQFFRADGSLGARCGVNFESSQLRQQFEMEISAGLAALDEQDYFESSDIEWLDKL